MDDSFPILQEVADLLKAQPGIRKMRVEGHTDSDGGADYNLGLSNSRAAAVVQWLVSTGGIAAERLESKGYGLTQPIDTNDTEQGRANNRRVEFKIISEDGATPQ
jgi:outer membrane protein OmpA-like peptidoglycan-associated protein